MTMMMKARLSSQANIVKIGSACLTGALKLNNSEMNRSFHRARPESFANSLISFTPLAQISISSDFHHVGAQRVKLLPTVNIFFVWKSPKGLWPTMDEERIDSRAERSEPMEIHDDFEENGDATDPRSRKQAFQ
ncbi:hypothetical protein CRG98_031241 [Punica granatum]|uniref:Uncharacterized protein n=1 Tax=Punica granatum TaxID=22663 RepID=A0A2I0IWL2_PUNGR|nr:hypothetical protein CRG98_031241 [Punica granatum]